MSRSKRILVIDVGGTHVKLLASGKRASRRFDSGISMTPSKMVKGVRALTADWPFDVIAMGYPGLVLHGRIAAEPSNLGSGWVGFDFPEAFGRPVAQEDLPFPHFASYCAAKGGVRMLTRTLAVEPKRWGITVNAIARGAIETEINRDLWRDPAKLRPLEANIPLGRIGKPDGVAAVAAFLPSADADYVTGATHFVDGGLAIY